MSRVLWDVDTQVDFVQPGGKLYVPGAQEARPAMARAWAAGYEALVVTVDLPVGGKRERDSYNRFVQPYRPRAGQILEAFTKPPWERGIVRNGGLPTTGNLPGPPNTENERLGSGTSARGRGHAAARA